MSNLSAAHFHDEPAAVKFLEETLWPNGICCPRCGQGDRVTEINGKTARPGLKSCGYCRKQFTVKVGTVFESSHIPLHIWLQATYLMVSSKKGISAHQLHRTLEITYKSAWFMAHRLREAMRTDSLPPIGGHNKVVEVDETYVGGKEKNKHANKKLRAGRGAVGKQPVVSLVERGGKVRSFHMPQVTAKTLKPILKAHINKKSYVMTDEAKVYPAVTGGFRGHGSVNHSAGEYVRGTFWHTNTVENYFSILKRGIVGTFHHVSQQHLSRYVAEFDFRYNERKIPDAMRADAALRGIVGKRLTYRDSST